MAYTEIEKSELINSVCEQIEQGNSLRKSLETQNIPSRSFYNIIEQDEAKMQQYARACELRAEKIFEEILEISDTTIEGVVLETDDQGRTKEKKGDMLGHRRLQVDARKWMLSKMNPKKYGDKIEQTVNGSIDIIDFSE